ncbi:MAG: DUF2585 family protein [Candidatus Binatia bacterium]
MSQVGRRSVWAWLAIMTTVVMAALQLRSQGRLWWCACGRLLVWVGDAWSADTSQHLLDPYSLTHVLHGFLFYWLFALVLPRLSTAWQLWLAVLIEVAWEVIENTDFVIQRYREATAALGYQGDTIVNSLGDILMCGLGFLFAWRLGFRRTLALFVLMEAVLLFWIKDNLLLNVVMLLYPIEGIKAWQVGH